jgi:hypothetical protein
MKPAFKNKIRSAKKPKHMGSVRIVVLVSVSFFAGVAATAFWFHRSGNSGPGSPVTWTPDLSAVGRPAPPPQAPPSVVIPQVMDPAIIDEVKQSVPNYASISLDDGENILRAAALKDFAAAAKELNDQVAAAQQKLEQSQNGQSPDDQQTAMKHLQDTQAAEAEKLKQVAARLQTQIATLKSLKNQQ